MTNSTQVSTLAVDRKVADRVRKAAETHGMTTLVMTTELLTYALDHGEITIERPTITIRPGASPSRPAKKPRRRSPKG